MEPLFGPGRFLLHRLAACLLGLAMLPPALAAAPKAAARAVPEELPAETLTTSTLKNTGKERIYVADAVIAHLTDSRVRVFNAQSGKILGMVGTGYVGNFTLSANAEELYVATSYFSRNTHGERTDVLEVHDTDTLAQKFEVILPPKRAQALNYRGLVRATGNGRFVLVQNATPATSITVVDLQERKVATEVQTPGCWGTLPAASGARFSMLCGDGKVATITLDDKGQVADRQLSDKLFDADTDAWFHHAEQLGDRYWFVSFLGTLTELNLGGPVAVKQATLSLVDATSRRGGWRPGGYQNFAVHPSGQRLVLAMHPKGGEGSHKQIAQQLWVFDLQSGKRIARLPGYKTASLTFSHSGERLHLLDGETGAMGIWHWRDNGRLKAMASIKRAGETSLHLESHD